MEFTITKVIQLSIHKEVQLLLSLTQPTDYCSATKRKLFFLPWSH